MNKYVEQLMKDLDLQVGEKFNVLGHDFNPYCFDENGKLYDCDNSYLSCLYIFDLMEGVMKIEKIPQKPKSVYDLKEGDGYFVLCEEGCIQNFIWTDVNYGICAREQGNTALTEEELVFKREKRKIETELLRLGGREEYILSKENYMFYRDLIDGGIAYECDRCCQRAGIYFDTLEDCKNAVGKIGKERIKRFYLRCSDD